MRLAAMTNLNAVNLIAPDDVQLIVASAVDATGVSTSSHLWIAAVPRAKALKAVLRATPVGSCVELRPDHLTPERLAELKMRDRDVRDLGAIDEIGQQDQRVMQ
jgi:hypothetical protein